MREMFALVVLVQRELDNRLFELRDILTRRPCLRQGDFQKASGTNDLFFGKREQRLGLFPDIESSIPAGYP